jgi:hypothetical protein
MAGIQGICQPQDGAQLGHDQSILLGEHLEIFIQNRRQVPAMVTDDIGDDLLLPLCQPDQLFALEQVIAMLVMIDSVDEMANIV